MLELLNSKIVSHYSYLRFVNFIGEMKKLTKNAVEAPNGLI